MLEDLNHRLFALLAAGPGMNGAFFRGAVLLAEFAIFVGPVLLALLWLFGETAQRRAAIGAGLSAVLALAIAATLSALIFHPRPFMDGLAPNYLDHAADSSFPSDHAAVLFALGFSMLLAPSAPIRRLGLVALATACAVGWARVYLGVHYPFDVAGAVLVGLLSAALFASSPGCKLRDVVTALGQRLYAIPIEAARSLRR